MKYIIKLKKIIMFIIDLFESWINYYHEKRIIKYVALANMLFIIILDLLIMVATYSVLYITNKTLFMSPLQLFMFYMIILLIITFQNIFDVDYNIAFKIKVLIFSVFDGLTIKQLLKNVGIFCGISIGLFTWLIISVNKYITDFNIAKINEESMLQLIVIIVLILTFIIYVYSINSSYSRNKRKLILYGISALVTFISTINNITEILDFKFVTSIIGLILSIDRFANAYSGLMESYSKNNECNPETTKEFCEEKNLTFEDLILITKNFFSKLISLIKNVWYKFKPMENKKKIQLILYIIFAPIIAFIVEGLIVSILGYGGSFIEGIFQYIFYKLNYETYGLEGVLWDIPRIIFKLIGIIIYIVAFIICISYIIGSILNMINGLKDKKKFKEIKKEIESLIISIFIFNFIIIAPFAIFNIVNSLISFIFKLILYIDLCILIIYIIICMINCLINVMSYLMNKVKEKLEKYKQDK
ncbi:hypothetical protein AXY43_13730 [Clostridium sp. MF28]|uniref:hypothetical protein n=1 Tax=Clostridium TaxID=1485 RepID=UPI000CF97818|nr:MULTISPECIES: hypothetical protein [Clostridium]AVK48995.1 hypothetical protein AXY43_13730 [Clostridium sp. MF28]PSM56391.1 hypothetical protein C4L39_17965 [Clostridium diolis]